MASTHQRTLFMPLAKLLATSHLKHYPKGQILIYSGDTTSKLYILKKGVVKVYDIDNQGNEKVLHIFKPPSIIPATFLRAVEGANEWFYSSLTDCDIYAVSQSEVERHMKADGQLATYLMHQFAEEAHELLIRLSSLEKTDTQDKLVYILRFLAVRHAHERKNGWRQVTFPITQQLLADMIGVSRESTAIGVKQLRELNIVRYPRTTVLEIHTERLRAHIVDIG